MDVPSASETRHQNLLRALHERTQARDWMSIHEVTEFFDGDEWQRAAWVEEAQRQGILDGDGGMVENYQLTARGTREAEQAAAARQDKALRQRELRKRLVAWADNQSTVAGRADLLPADFASSNYGDFLGEKFTADEITRAGTYLVERGLLCVAKAWGHDFLKFGITTEGQDCALDYEADVPAYLARNQNQSGQVFNIQADGSNFAIAAGAGSSASADGNQVNVEAALTLAQMIEQALPTLNLDGDAGRYLEDLRDTSDPGKMRKALVWFSQALTATSTGALGSMLATMAQAALGG